MRRYDRLPAVELQLAFGGRNSTRMLTPGTSEVPIKDPNGFSLGHASGRFERKSYHSLRWFAIWVSEMYEKGAIPISGRVRFHSALRIPKKSAVATTCRACV